MNNTKNIPEKYLHELSTLVSNLNLDEINTCISVIRKVWFSGGQIITLGNGGSSLTALHFINDWNKSIYLATGKKFFGRSLVDNLGLLMSYSNDISFEDVFVEQLKNIMKSSDLVIGISGSGNSINVIKAIQYASDNGAMTIGLSGYDGGLLRKTAQYNFCANCNDMQLSEDVHFIFGHMVMKSLCEGGNT